MSIEKYIEEFKAKYVVECDEIGLLKWASCPEQVIELFRTSLEEYGRERFEAGLKIGMTEDEELKEEKECEHNFIYVKDKIGYRYEECIKCGKAK